MKPETLKTFVDVHAWTGLGAGLALFIAFYAGALTVFFHELEEWDGYNASPSLVQDYGQAQDLIDLVLEYSPDAGKRLMLDLSSEHQSGNQVRWFERLQDDTFKTHYYRLDANGVLNTVPDNTHLARFIYVLHYSVGLPVRLGLYLLGVVCIIYGMALVTGLVIFMPNFFRDLFVVRTGSNKKRFWLDAHNVVGVLSFPWHIMFAWSSAVLAIAVFALAPFQYLVFEEDMIKKLGPELGVIEAKEPAGRPAELLPVDKLIAIASRELPALQPTQLRYQHIGDVNASVTIRGNVAADVLTATGTVALNATTGQVIRVHDPEIASFGAAFYQGLITLHFASFGGDTTRWVYFFMSLAGAFLFYTGNLLWVESRRKRRQVLQLKSTVFMARLNSGVCIGCMAGISAAFLASRILVGWDSKADMTELVYYAVFFVALAWCFLRPVATGTRDLLYATAALTAAIPLFDAVLVDMPLWRSVIDGEWVLVAVDLVALAAAFGFWAMGRAVQHRAEHGDPNSVWAQGSAALVTGTGQSSKA